MSAWNNMEAGSSISKVHSFEPNPVPNHFQRFKWEKCLFFFLIHRCHGAAMHRIVKFIYCPQFLSLTHLSVFCRQCCGTVTIFYGSGSGSDFWKVMVPVPVPVLTFEKVMVPVPVRVPTFGKLRFRFQFHIFTIKSKFFLKNLFPFYIVGCFTRKKIININKFIVKCERKKC